MSKVLVDRELLEYLADLGDEAIERMGSYLAEKHGEQKYVDAARAILAQAAEAEGVSNARLMNTLAELARRAPLRTLHTICETQHQVSTVKLERYLEPIGDTLAGYAFTLRIDFDKLSSALSAVTVERDALLAEREGKVLVPVEPTLDMQNAGWRELGDQGIEPEAVEIKPIYCAMLAALAAKEE